MNRATYHSRELELFCRAENIETPHVYECELDNKRVLRYRCLDCSSVNFIPNVEELEIIKAHRELRQEDEI